MSAASIRPESPMNVISWRHALAQTVCAGVVVLTGIAWNVFGRTQSAISEPTVVSRPASLTSFDSPFSPTRGTQDRDRLPVRALMSNEMWSQVTQVISKAQQASEEVSSLSIDIELWQLNRRAILENWEGRRIASDSRQLAIVSSAMQRNVLDPNRIRDWNSQLETVINKLSLAQQASDSDFTIDSRVLELIDRIRHEVAENCKQIQRDRELVEGAVIATAQLKLAPQTLSEALSLRATTTLTTKTPDRITQVESKTTTYTPKSIPRSDWGEAYRLPIGNALSDSQIERNAAASGWIAADFESDLPEIKSHLSAFISSGTTSRRGMRGRTGPMSLFYLKSQGVMQPSAEGKQQLVRLTHCENDRPAGVIPRSLTVINSEGICSDPAVDRAQSLLIKYGKLLVERGMLEP